MMAGLSSVRLSLSLLLLILLLLLLFLFLLLHLNRLMLVPLLVPPDSVGLAAWAVALVVSPLTGRLVFKCLEFKTLARLLLLGSSMESIPVDVEVGRIGETPSLAPSSCLELSYSMKWIRSFHLI